MARLDRPVTRMASRSSPTARFAAKPLASGRSVTNLKCEKIDLVEHALRPRIHWQDVPPFLHGFQNCRGKLPARNFCEDSCVPYAAIFGKVISYEDGSERAPPQGFPRIFRRFAFIPCMRTLLLPRPILQHRRKIGKCMRKHVSWRQRFIVSQVHVGDVRCKIPGNNFGENRIESIDILLRREQSPRPQEICMRRIYRQTTARLGN